MRLAIVGLCSKLGVVSLSKLNHDFAKIPPEQGDRLGFKSIRATCNLPEHEKRRKIDYGCAATITRVDRFLPIQGQSVGIFGHGDLSEKRFGWKPALSSASIAATSTAISPFQLRLQSDAPPD